MTLRFKNEDIRKYKSDFIELFCKDGFPKMREEGKLSGRQIREKARSLIGYNKRVKFLDYDDNKMVLSLEIFNNKAQCGVCHTLQAAGSDE